MLRARADLSQSGSPILIRRGEIVELIEFVGPQVVRVAQGVWSADCFYPAPDPAPFMPKTGMTIYHPDYPRSHWKVLHVDSHWIVIQLKNSKPHVYKLVDEVWSAWKEA